MLSKMKVFLEQFISLRSLRARVFFIILLTGIVPSIIISFVIVGNYEKKAIENRIGTVQNQLNILADHLIYEEYLSAPSSTVINAELEMLSSLYEGRVLIINGNYKVIKDTYGISEGKIDVSESVIKCFLGQSLASYNEENKYIEITTPIINKTSDTNTEKSNAAVPVASGTSSNTAGVVRGVMLTVISVESIDSTKEVLQRRAVIIECIMVMVIIAVALVLSIVLVKPFDRITEAINEVKEGFSDETISVPDYVETIHIVDAFNQLLHRMKVLDDSRQEFVSNVSHELKTPLTSMKVLAESLIGQENLPVELYEEFMTDIVSEIDRENQIITDLLSLVKMDKTAASLNITTVDINELTELILKRLRPLARKKDVEVVFESMRNVVAEVDEVKITLVMTNLVENAIKYNKEHGWVKVKLDADHQFFTFVVSDSGIGIPETELTHIYERFYRADKSHSREIGGTGLGLAITKNAILMHRGVITVNSIEGEGSSFLVKIPLSVSTK